MTHTIYFLWAVSLMISSFYFFSLGQDNPLPSPLQSVATIACPFGKQYSLVRGADATVMLRCLE